MCAGIDGVQVFIDDIIIWGRNKDQHDQRVKIVRTETKQKQMPISSTKHQLSWRQADS